MVSFSSDLDSGNGRLVSINGTHVCVEVADDAFTELENKTHKQWFHFRLAEVGGQDIKVSVVNAGKCAFPVAWQGYDVCASYDRQKWFRVRSAYDDATGELSWSMHAEKSVVYFAYFPPYSRERHLDLISYCADRGASVRTLGKSLQQRDIDLVTLGNGPKKVWFIARQHPGESMGEWFIQGLLHRLLTKSDPVSRHLLEDATFYVVPNINPDGSYLGYLRTNAAGCNLNREWHPTGDYEAPLMMRSPEVYLVLEECKKIGCDLFLDVHGDEELPYNFISGIEGCHVWGPRLKTLQTTFSEALMNAYPAFQMTYGYDADEPLSANYAMCSNKIAQDFDCLALTLEMPFKDCIDCRGKQETFLNEEAISFGAAMLDAVKTVLPTLRE